MNTGFNSTSRKVLRNVILKKTSTADVDRNSSSPLSSEPSVKESEVGVDVDMEAVKEDVKEDEKPLVRVDIDVDSLPDTTSSTMAIKPQDRPSIDPIPVTATSSVGSEDKKSSTSASTATSFAMLKRKGSSDTIKTFNSSTHAPIIVDAPLIKQLSPTPISQPPPPSQDHQPPQITCRQNPQHARVQSHPTRNYSRN